jgi:hypothetical protein
VAVLKKVLERQLMREVLKSSNSLRRHCQRAIFKEGPAGEQLSRMTLITAVSKKGSSRKALPSGLFQERS